MMDDQPADGSTKPLASPVAVMIGIEALITLMPTEAVARQIKSNGL